MRFRRLFSSIDWFLLASAVGLTLAGLATMRSFSADNAFFEKQVLWIVLALTAFFVASLFEYDFLRQTLVVTGLYATVALLLLLVLSFGALVKGAQNRFNLGLFALQPSDPARIILVALLSKYFARRHIEIARFRHVLLSGLYAFVLFALAFFQPDLGSGIIIASIWLGMVLVAGISWKHLAVLFTTALIVFAGLWHWGLQPYQKQRILTFVHPLTDVRGSGYNAYQSMVAVGSGQLVGKGIGYGTQSKLRFLPEYQTDFIFAAFAEEWGFVGVVLALGLFSVVIIRILMIAAHGADNFDMLFAAGIAICLIAQSIVHIGMNVGLLPITGTTMPFMSYGGSHLLTEYFALGMLVGMRRHARQVGRVQDQTELVGAL